MSVSMVALTLCTIQLVNPISKKKPILQKLKLTIQSFKSVPQSPKPNLLEAILVLFEEKIDLLSPPFIQRGSE